MPLDPLVRQWLDSLYGSPFTPLHELRVEQARRQMMSASQMLGPGEPVAVVEDLEAAGPAGPVPVRIYRPTADDRPSPLVVYFHGGGWVIGSIDSHDAYCRSLANSSGWTVASVEYRLAPEHRFPAAFDDAYAATCWLSEQSRMLRIAADRIAVAGDSAGGNLAAAVTLAARDRNGPPLAAQVLIYPITDCRFDTPSYTANAEGYHLSRETMIWFWRQYVNAERQWENPYAAPLRAGSLQALPPAMILVAEFDPLLDDGEAYAQRLREAGNRVQVRRYDGMIHGFVRRTGEWKQARRALAHVAEFLSAIG